jgi:hypothetical protein
MPSPNVRLRTGDYVAALKDFARSVENQTDGERAYHLALTYQYLGKEDLAKDRFMESEEQGYTPTYERLFTPRRNERNGSGSE